VAAAFSLARRLHSRIDDVNLPPVGFGPAAGIGKLTTCTAESGHLV
jgi:hypothetical protein